MSKTFKTPQGTELPLINLKNKDYLGVQQRVQWFREEKPNYGIETEFIQLTNTSALAKATIKDEAGRIVSVSHKYEDQEGFNDFREKAETGAIGRALALIGFGTQFALELDEGERIVDSPQAPIEKLSQTDSLIKQMADHQTADDYVIPFGKLKGKKLNEVPLTDLQSYCNWLIQSASKDNKPLSKLAKEFIDEVVVLESKASADFTAVIDDNVPF